jgi:hypothetical protein
MVLLETPNAVVAGCSGDAFESAVQLKPVAIQLELLADAHFNRGRTHTSAIDPCGVDQKTVEADALWTGLGARDLEQMRWNLVPIQRALCRLTRTTARSVEMLLP